MNAPEKSKPTYDYEKEDKKYLCNVTGLPCIAREMDDSRDGPPPMCYTLYEARLDRSRLYLCPIMPLPQSEKERIKILLAEQEKERNISELEEKLEKLKEKGEEKKGVLK